MSADDKLVISRALNTEIAAFEKRLAADKAADRQASVVVTDYLQKLRGALSRLK